jgi:hypothetical protein
VLVMAWLKHKKNERNLVAAAQIIKIRKDGEYMEKPATFSIHFVATKKY